MPGFLNKKTMEDKNQKDGKAEELRDEARIGGKMPGRNITEKTEIEQARMENRRDADLEDKTPGGDAGPEDRREEKDEMEETNY